MQPSSLIHPAVAPIPAEDQAWRRHAPDQAAAADDAAGWPVRMRRRSPSAMSAVAAPGAAGCGWRRRRPAALRTPRAGVEAVEQTPAVFAGQRAVGDAAGGFLQPGAEGGALLGRGDADALPQQVVQRVAPAGGRHRARPGSRAHPAGGPACPDPRPTAAWRLSASAPGPASAARVPRRGRRPGRRRHRRRSTAPAAGDRRHSSSSCSSVSAVPSGATAAVKPAWCSAITSM